MKNGHSIGIVVAAAIVWSILPAEGALIDVTLMSGDQHSVLSDSPDGSPLVGTGMAWGDFDSDGDQDLYVTNWQSSVLPYPANALFRNNGDGTFTNVAALLKVTLEQVNNSAAAWADYDNDGDLDLFVADFYSRSDALFKNLLAETGSVGFENVAAVAGFRAFPGSSTSAAWADYDGDGWLDLYIGRYYAQNVLYRNNGDGTFKNAAVAAGVADERDTDGVAWADYDLDGDPDLYVVNREQDNALYRNDGGGIFSAVACGTGTGDIRTGRNAVWGDCDNDGDLDLYVVNVGAKALYRNEADHLSFADIARQAGVSQTKPGWVSWDAAWGDYDNDGDQDLVVVGGGESLGESPVLFANDGAAVFTDATASLIPGTSKAHSVACGSADYDNDGDLDLFVVNGGGGTYEADSILRNDLNDKDPSIRNWVKVRPRRAGTTGKVLADGIGAKVTLLDAENGSVAGYREIISCTSALEALFGVTPGRTYEVHVVFPSDRSSTQTAVGGDVVDTVEGR